MPSTHNSGRVKLGVVGGGFMGQLAHLENYVNVDNCDIVALAELRPELRQRVCDRHGIPRSYASHTALLNDPEVEAVVAITARTMTGPVASDCLNARKHLLTEKPMAATVEQARKLVNISQVNDLIYSVGYMRRHDEGVQKGKQILDELRASDELGPVVAVRVHSFQGDSYCHSDGHIVTDETVPDDPMTWPIAPDWIPQERQIDYAWFNNVYCHMFNMVRYLFEKTPTVNFVRLDYQRGRVAVLDFDGFLGVFHGGNSNARVWDEVIDIHFTYGRLTIKMPPNLLKNVPAQIELIKEKDTHEILIPQCDWSWAFRRQAEAFISDVQAHTKPIASGADGLEDLKLIEEIWRYELQRGKSRG